MKYIQSLFVTVSVLLACMPLHAQWAGENKKLLQQDDNLQQTTIGLPDAESDRCYEWSGPNILSDIHQPVITVNPRNSINIYRVIRRSPCGVEKDSVIVSLVDSIVIKSVKPLRKCYKDGDSIYLSDFEIETDPPGYSSMVKLSPQKASNHWGNNQEEEEVTFSLTYAQQTSTKKVNVNVYNESLAITGGITSFHFTKVMKELEEMQKIVKKVDGLVDKLNKKAVPLAPALGPCQPLYDIAITPIDYHYFRTCCEGEDVTGFTIMGLYFAPRIGVDCYFPSPWKIPRIGGINFHLGASGGLNLGPLSYTFKGDCSEANSIPVELYADISLGAELEAIHRDILSLQLDAVGSATATLAWDVGNGVSFDGLKLDLILVGKLTFISFISEEVKYPIGSYKFFSK